MGDTEKALEMYKEGINRDPECDLLYLNIGAIFGKRNEFKQSLYYADAGNY